ncbi:MAG: GtrA family protein [Lysobacterales bacterium]|nr:MAG: GtrA family protein [Xanthomonadales bacterium]
MIRAREFTLFTIVGTSAAGVNLAVVAGTVPFGVSPLVANVIGFLLAFVLSFVGHARWSFPAVGRPVGLALRRFAVLSVLGFGCNEACYAGALSWTELDYRLALVVVITILGLLKLLASKHWAFAVA